MSSSGSRRSLLSYVRLCIAGLVIAAILILPLYGLFLWFEGGGRNGSPGAAGNTEKGKTCGRTVFVAKSKRIDVQ